MDKINSFEVFDKGEKNLDAAIKRTGNFAEAVSQGRSLARELPDNNQVMQDIDTLEAATLRAQAALLEVHRLGLVLKAQYGPSPTRSGGT